MFYELSSSMPQEILLTMIMSEQLAVLPIREIDIDKVIRRPVLLMMLPALMH